VGCCFPVPSLRIVIGADPIVPVHSGPADVSTEESRDSSARRCKQLSQLISDEFTASCNFYCIELEVLLNTGQLFAFRCVAVRKKPCRVTRCHVAVAAACLLFGEAEPVFKLYRMPIRDKLIVGFLLIFCTIDLLLSRFHVRVSTERSEQPGFGHMRTFLHTIFIFVASPAR